MSKYSIEIHLENQAPQRYPFEKSFIIGSSSQADYTILDADYSPKQLIIRDKNNMLTVNNLSDKTKASLEGQELVTGKMYFIDLGDKITLGDMEIYIKEFVSTDDDPTYSALAISEEGDRIDLGAGGASSFAEKTMASIKYGISKISKKNSKKRIDLPKTKNKTSVLDKLTTVFSFKKNAKNHEEDGPKIHSKMPRKDFNEPTQVRKINSILKNKKVMKKKRKNKGVSRPSIYDPPGFFIRFFNFIFVLYIAYVVRYNFENIPFEKLNIVSDLLTSNLTSLSPLLIKQLPEFKTHINEALTILKDYSFVLNFILFAILIDIALQFILGTPIGYIICGYSNKNNFIVSRIKSIVLNIIRVITLPLFFIFDLPAIIKSRTLKEVISGTTYYSKSNKLKILGPILIMPFLLVAITFIPTFTEIDVPKENFSDRMPQPKLRLRESDMLIEGPMPFNSNSHIKTKIANVYNILPFLNKDGPLESILIENKTKNTYIVVNKISNIKVFNTISKNKNLFPLFKQFFPNLSKNLNSMDYSKEVNEDLFKLLNICLNLNFSQIHEYILNFGPHLKFSENILKDLLNEGMRTKRTVSIPKLLTKISKVRLYKGKTNFLSVEFIRRSKIVRRYFSLDNKSPSYEIYYDNNSKNLTKMFEEHFLLNFTSKKVNKVDIGDEFKDTLFRIDQLSQNPNNPELSNYIRNIRSQYSALTGSNNKKLSELAAYQLKLLPTL